MTTLMSDFSHSDPFRASSTPVQSPTGVPSSSSRGAGATATGYGGGASSGGATDGDTGSMDQRSVDYHVVTGNARMSTPPFSPNNVMAFDELVAEAQAQARANGVVQGQHQHTRPTPTVMMPLSPPAEPRHSALPYAGGGGQQHHQPPQHSSSSSQAINPNSNSRKRATYAGGGGSGGGYHSQSRTSTSTPSPPTMTPEYTLHPSIAAYQTAHPRRALINFGPYILLQTLGEGEFGKVKLGVHEVYGEEVAVKLIRKDSVDNPVRMSKVEREIEVLKNVNHPNIVRLFDVIETEKYIGIILDFANGGELFDHILAHRYLKEKDAAKLFAQLISGVHYLHQKHIVHRDLKLENLLLDKHRNVIITDFGFANRFEHRQDDLMATSCGSPCYAAPELVISEGLYVGSAVDIWSCGVILYAMLSGYLPFDDDPANPDGNNINLLYRYIVNTPLTFPDYVSIEARDLLSKMLVPDPLNRCDLPTIMAHPWLRMYAPLFHRSVEELEIIAQEQQDHKRAVSRRDMQARRRAQEEARIAQLARHAARAAGQSTKGLPVGGPHGMPAHHRHQSALPTTTTMPDYLYNAGSRRSAAPTTTLPNSATSAGLAAFAAPESGAPATAPASQTEHLPRAGLQPASVPMEIDSSDSGVEQDVAVPVEKFENVENVEPTPSGRSRAESMQLPTTPKGKSSRSQPLNDITPTQATVAPVRQEVIKDRERDPIAEARRERKESSSPAPSDGSKRRPASSNKNRHTIQVEYDGEAAYEKLLEVQEGRAAWARGERVQAEQGKDSPTSTLAPELPKSIEVEQIQDKIEELATELATSPEDYSSTARLTVPSEPSQSHSSTTGTITPLPLPVANAQVHSETPSALPVQPTPPTTSEPPLRVSMAPEPPASRSNSRATATSQKSRTSMPPPALPHIRQPSPSLQEPIPQSAQSSTFGRQTVGLPQPPAASRADRSRKRMSMDKFGLGKLLASANMSTDSFSRTPSRSSEASHAAKLQRAESIKAKEAAKQRQKDSDKATKKGRRTTLSLASGSFTRDGSAVGQAQAPPPPASAPISTTGMSTPVAPVGSSAASSRSGRPPSMIIQGDRILSPHPTDRSPSNPSITTSEAFAAGATPSAAKPTASSSAARKVMDWFRRKSLAKSPFSPPSSVRRDDSVSIGRSGYPGGPGVLVPTSASIRTEEAALSSTSDVVDQTQSEAPPAVFVTAEPEREVASQAVVTMPDAPAEQAPSTPVPVNTVPIKTGSPKRPGNVPQRAKSHRPGTFSGISHPTLPATPISTSPDARLRTHAGVVDQAALTSKPAKEVMDEVIRVLFEMGIEVKRESDFKLRCLRPRRKKAGATTGLGLSSVVSGGSLASVTMIGSASTGGVDRRGLPLPSSPSGLLSPGGGLRGILRRGSSYGQGSPHPASPDLGSPTLTSPNPGNAQLPEPLYGEHTVDGGDEVRFSVEVTRIKNLPGLLSLDIKRLRGNIWSFKFVYQTVLERCETLTH